MVYFGRRQKRSFKTPLPNWVDLAVAVILWRCCYGGLDRGLFCEFLLFIGAVSVCALTINFAGPVADWVRPWVFNEPKADLIVYVLVFLNLLLASRVIIQKIIKLIPLESSNWIMHGGGLVLGAARAFWWLAVLFVLLTSLGISYLQASVTEHSVVGARLSTPARELIAEVTGRFPGVQYRRDYLIPPFTPKKIGSTRR